MRGTAPRAGGGRTIVIMALVLGFVIASFQIDGIFRPVDPSGGGGGAAISSTRAISPASINANNVTHNEVDIVLRITPRIARIAAGGEKTEQSQKKMAPLKNYEHVAQKHGSQTCSFEYTERLQQHHSGSYIIKEDYQLPASTQQAIKNHSDYLFTTKWGNARGVVSVSEYDARLLHAVVRDACLYAIRRSGTCTTVETGFALGSSAIAILEAHQAALDDVLSITSNDTKDPKQPISGQQLVHYGVDPFQDEYFEDVGLRSVANYLSDLQSLKPIIPDVFLWRETAALALASCITDNAVHSCFDVIFMDDGHRFEQNIVELSLSVPLLPLGGILVLHDSWVASVKATRSWIETNLRDVLQPVSQNVSKNVFVFIKVANDKRTWDHFVPFDTQFKNKVE